MIQSFRDQGTQDLFHGKSTLAARRVVPFDLLQRARDKLDFLNQAVELWDLASPPGNRLEALRGDRVGQYSIRLNSKYRVCFFWTAGGPSDVEIVEYH